MQQGMLFHSLYAPNSGAYIEQITCRFEGRLDLDAFEGAWRQVLKKHPILRTAFLWEGLDEPLQVIRENAEITIEILDWQVLERNELGQRLSLFLETDRCKGFDISSAPLTRCFLAKVAPDNYEFIWTFHHLILDGWSIPLVLRDFFVAYNQLSTGSEPVTTLKNPRPYRDYIAWLQQQPEEKGYWQDTLRGFSNPTPLGVDLAPRDLGDKNGAVYKETSFKMSTSVTEGLEAFTRQQQLTMNTLVLGAWALLLSRYCGHKDIVIGATVSGRSPDLSDANDMVGMFVNTLPVRIKIEDDSDVVGWLRRLQAQLVEARQYEHSSLVQVHGWSDVPRGVPLFDSIVSFQNQPIAEVLRTIEFGPEVNSFVAHHTRTTYPLTLVVEPDTELKLVMIYDNRRFTDSSLEQIFEHLQTLLTALTTHCECTLSSLSIMSQVERNSVLGQMSPIQASLAERSPCVHHLFEQQVEKSPDSIALVVQKQRLSYRELNIRANQLAHYLMEQGVGPEKVVAICLPRSVDTIVAILAVLKAGGTYLPLDPEYPRQRLLHMFQDSQASVLLTHETVDDKLKLRDARVICIDKEHTSFEAFSESNPPSRSGPDNLMYIIYTSGSSGRPKGSQHTHGNVRALFDATDKLHQYDKSDVWTMFHSFAFDFAVWEMWGALRSGGQLIMVNEQATRSPHELFELLQEHAATVLSITPSVFRQFIHHAVEQDIRLPLKQVIFGGEALDFRSLEPWFEKYGFNQPSLINMYGITETSVHVTHRLITTDDYPANGRSLIGKPLNDLHAYILDDELQPVPRYVEGELYIGGRQLARGYLNRPALTAERFLPSPFSKSGERLYRTGDRARFVDGMEIEYLGRIDNQIKIRGFRIETGEVEATIRGLEQVRDAAVAVYEDASGDKRMLANLVTESNDSLTTAEIRGFLAKRLPAHMIPSRFVFTESLPVTPNGKVDRSALQIPTDERPETGGEFIAPRNDLEQELAEIWCEVLGLQSVGVRDDFFELGGHSLQVTSLISRVRDTYQVDLPLRRLFEVTTIESLAIAILHSHSEETNPDLIDDIFAELENLGVQEHEGQD